MIHEDDEARALYASMTDFQQRYVTCRLAGMAKVQAWVQAGGTRDGATTAYVTEKVAKVARYMEIVRGKQHDDTIMGMKEMARRLSAVARTSIDDLVEIKDYEAGVDDEGNPVQQSAWQFRDAAARDPMAMTAISELTLNKQGKPVIKMHSPLNAMKQLAELMGYEAPKRVEIGPVVTAPPDTDEVDAKEAAAAYQAMLKS